MYANDIYIFYQYEDVHKIQHVLNEKFSWLYQWFIDNKLLMHSGEDKTKSVLFSNTKY